jgi:D-lactate dehydrogenase
MALIYFYDSTDLDKQQLSEALAGTDHHWEYVVDKISPDNTDQDAEVISVFISSNVSREVIETMPKLKLIACRSTGFDNIDLTAAAEKGIVVANVPTYGEATVAEYAFTLLLALTRKLPAVFRADREEFTSEELMGHDLEGKTFGALGTGHIGLKALNIARGFSMQTLAYDAFPKDELMGEYGFKYVGLDELLQRCDILSVHVPYMPATHHIMNRDNLKKMKRGAILINTARGELVDTKALTELLDSGHLGGAAIDVVEGEALLNYHEETVLLRSETVPDQVLNHSVEVSMLEHMPNVIISPHNAFNTVEALERINKTTAQNIIDFWYDKIPNKVEAPKPTVGKLLVIRHAQSEWNASGKWTGITDVHLSEKGFKQAAELGRAVKQLGIKIDKAFCSQQLRTRETLEGVLDASQQFDVDTEVSGALNERDYGEYTGKNKWEVKQQIGEEAFNNIRRGWDVPIKDGESLKDVYERAVPFYKDNIWPLLKSGKNVLIVAHGNSIRALTKYLESISDQDIAGVEMPFGDIKVYDLTPEGLARTFTVTHIPGASEDA